MHRAEPGQGPGWWGSLPWCWEWQGGWTSLDTILSFTMILCLSSLSHTYVNSPDNVVKEQHSYNLTKVYTMSALCP